MFFTVKQQTVAIVQRFGKHKAIAHAGLNLMTPIIDSVVARLDLRIQELVVRCETKTKDNVFVQMTVAVQFQIQNPFDAYYKLANPRAQIESYVYDVVRARVPSLTLDQAFEAKDDVAHAVKEQLADIMDDFGYLIVKALVTDIDPDIAVKESMNRINAAERLKVAAEMEAEADKIRQVKAAEAEAESKHLQGIGIAKQRKAIADGLSESAELVRENLSTMSAETIMSLLLMTQYFDTLQTMADKSGTRTIFMPHSPSGMDEIYNQVQKAVTVGESLQASGVTSVRTPTPR
ncbi:MAG: SPFH domain-containing protein [Myxococcales bacterium]|nr:SPFH domain-containing protein [Myxococcales bacterium]